MFNIQQVQQLQNKFSGDLLLPGKVGYDQARMCWNLAIDQHPALILIANDVQDVMRGVSLTREAGLGIAVQSTGHGVKYPADDSLLVITSRMRGVQVNAAAHIARIEAGAVWKQVLDRSTPLGLAPLLGTSPNVGVVGYALGGGIGWLARKYGLASDSIRRIELVTPDGQMQQASLDENSELFWGLRGGGGNFGVVTMFEF